MSKKKVLIISLIIALCCVGIGLIFIIFNRETEKKMNEQQTENKIDENATDNDSISIEKISYDLPNNISRHGKPLDIYKYVYEDNEISYGEFDSYSIGKAISYEKVGSFTQIDDCVNTECRILKIDSNYVLTAENGNYYLYNYKTNKIILYKFGSFENENFYENIDILENEDDNEMLAFIFTEEINDNDYISNIYQIKNNTIYQNIPAAGKADRPIDPSYEYVDVYQKYGLIPMYSNGNIMLFDIINSKIIKTINDYTLIDYINIDEETYYILYKTDENGYVTGYLGLFNHLGNQVLENKEIEDIVYENNKLIIQEPYQFKVYDKNFSLIKESKEYDDVLLIMKDYIVTLQNNKLQLINANDEFITTFTDNYDTNRCYFHSLISGWDEKNNKNGIYLIVQDKNVTFEEAYNYMKKTGEADGVDLDYLKSCKRGYEYYYIPQTGETGKNPTIIFAY